MGEVNHLPEIEAIGSKLGKSPVQVTLRWLLQKGVVVIPKSVNPLRIKDNINIFDFELSAEDMKLIEGLDQGRRLGPDPGNFNF